MAYWDELVKNSIVGLCALLHWYVCHFCMWHTNPSRARIIHKLGYVCSLDLSSLCLQQVVTLDFRNP